MLASELLRRIVPRLSDRGVDVVAGLHAAGDVFAADGIVMQAYGAPVDFTVAGNTVIVPARAGLAFNVMRGIALVLAKSGSPTAPTALLVSNAVSINGPGPGVAQIALATPSFGGINTSNNGYNATANATVTYNISVASTGGTLAARAALSLSLTGWIYALGHWAAV